MHCIRSRSIQTAAEKVAAKKAAAKKAAASTSAATTAAAAKSANPPKPTTFSLQPLAWLAALALCAALPLSALAQAAVPERPLKIILPVGPGSGVDTITRAVAPPLSNMLGGQSVVIENQPGAGGITGTHAMIKSAPDGHTISLISNHHVIYPGVYPSLPFYPVMDITPLAVIGPKGMAPEQIKRLHSALSAAFAVPEVQEEMARQGNPIRVSTPEAAGQHFRAELDKYARLVKKAGIRVD